MYSHWDKEAKHLMAETQHLGIEANALVESLESGIPEQKMELEEMQSSFFQNLEKIKSQTVPPTLLSPRQHALVVWCHNYASQLAQFYDKELRLLGKRMWMALVQTRVSGHHDQQRHTLSENDLMDMAVRHGRLKKTENFLSNQLMTLNKRKEELKQQYRDVELRFANQQAAQSLHGSFGSSAKDALSHPILSGLSQIMRNLTWPFRLSSSEKSTFRDMESQLKKRTDSVVSQCQNEIMRTLSPSGHDRLSTLPNRSKSSLNEIDQLRHRYQHNVAAAASRKAPVARPKVVKNSLNFI